MLAELLVLLVEPVGGILMLAVLLLVLFELPVELERHFAVPGSRVPEFVVLPVVLVEPVVQIPVRLPAIL